ncbi:MAG: hypothetical protein Q7U59_10280 [Lutibacter sp.]|nr:hypothetical protein [Lutibacter sp.]
MITFYNDKCALPKTQYLKEQFLLIFAGLSIAIGSATFLNASLVLKYGMEKMVTAALISFFSVSLLYIVLFLETANPSIGILLTFFRLQFFAIGFLFGNLRALAMEPIGHIAGIGAAITGFLSTMMAVPISTLIGKYVTATALPLFIGFLICSTMALLILVYLKVSGNPQIIKKMSIKSI